LFLVLLRTVVEHGRDLPQKLSRRNECNHENVILTSPRIHTQICGLQVTKHWAVTFVGLLY